MYNLSELSPYSTLQMQMAMSTTQADANSHVPKTPEIINTLMAMTHPLDNVPLVKLEGNNTDANVPSVKLEENNTDDNNVPKTPEIINSLMAITNPLDSYVAGSSVDMNATSRVSSAKSALERFGISDKNMTDKVSNGPLQSPTTVQNMCSQLIKEELKVTLQRKKREHLLSSSSSACSPVEYTDLSIMSDCSSSSKNSNGRRIESVDTEEEDQEDGSCHSGTDLTEEDADKRRKRRERNKIAATKCRLKKKEKTVTLVQESEILENQNYSLKNQIQELEVQRRRLVDMLSLHKPICTKSLPMATTLNTAAANSKQFQTL